MDATSRALLYLVLAVPALYVALFVLALGPVGMFALAFVLLAVLAATTWDDGADPPVRTNCPACGSPNPPERDRCDYCEAPLGGDN